MWQLKFTLSLKSESDHLRMCYEDLRNFMEAGFLKVAAENPGSGPIEMVNLLNYEAGFDSFDKSKAC